ncbi:MAG: hypothetical protein JWM18_3333, partial [Chloroflexi bacterium]|nr:hypothetical protein [Chloroflexota bacterium]
MAFSRAELGTIDASLQAQERYIAAAIPRNPSETFADRDLLPNQNPVGVAISAVLLDESGRLLDDSGQAPPAGPLAPIVGEVRRSGQLLDSRSVEGERQRVLATRIPIDR